MEQKCYIKWFGRFGTEGAMKRTGVFATEQEKERCMKLLKEAQETPVIAFSSKHALEEGGLSGQAWQRVKEECHSIALKHGLPEIKGFYGMTQEGEFVTC